MTTYALYRKSYNETYYEEGRFEVKSTLDWDDVIRAANEGFELEKDRTYVLQYIDSDGTPGGLYIFQLKTVPVELNVEVL